MTNPSILWSESHREYDDGSWDGWTDDMLIRDAVAYQKQAAVHYRTASAHREGFLETGSQNLLNGWWIAATDAASCSWLAGLRVSELMRRQAEREALFLEAAE